MLPNVVTVIDPRIKRPTIHIPQTKPDLFSSGSKESAYSGEIVALHLLQAKRPKRNKKKRIASRNETQSKMATLNTSPSM